jgi:hypothetical protein
MQQYKMTALPRVLMQTQMNNTLPMNTAERLQSPLLSCTINHHHHQYAAGTGHQSAFIISITTRQQDQAVRLPTTTTTTL